MADSPDTETQQPIRPSHTNCMSEPPEKLTQMQLMWECYLRYGFLTRYLDGVFVSNYDLLTDRQKKFLRGERRLRVGLYACSGIAKRGVRKFGRHEYAHTLSRPIIVRLLTSRMTGFHLGVLLVATWPTDVPPYKAICRLGIDWHAAQECYRMAVRNGVRRSLFSRPWVGRKHAKQYRKLRQS